MQVTLVGAITVIAVALPVIGRDMHLDESGLVLVSSGYGIAFGGLLPAGGRLADRAGRRRAFVTGTAVFGLASAGAGLAPRAGLLVTARLAEGAGAALATPAAVALVGAVCADPGRHGRALATWGVLSSTGAIAGTVVSGAAVTWMPWRWIFAAPVVIAAVAVAAGVVLLASFVLAERRHPAPLVPLPFLARRALPLAAVLACAAAMATAFFLLSLYLQQVRGLAALQVSAIFLLPAPAAVTAGPLAGAVS